MGSSVGENLLYTNTKIHEGVKLIVKCVFVLVYCNFSPILVLLFEHSRIYKGVQKFILENPSYIIVYGNAVKIRNGNPSPEIPKSDNRKTLIGYNPRHRLITLF